MGSKLGIGDWLPSIALAFTASRQEGVIPTSTICLNTTSWCIFGKREKGSIMDHILVWWWRSQGIGCCRYIWQLFTPHCFTRIQFTLLRQSALGLPSERNMKSLPLTMLLVPFFVLKIRKSYITNCAVEWVQWVVDHDHQRKGNNKRQLVDISCLNKTYILVSLPLINSCSKLS